MRTLVLWIHLGRLTLVFQTERPYRGRVRDPGGGWAWGIELRRIAPGEGILSTYTTDKPDRTAAVVCTCDHDNHAGCPAHGGAAANG